MPYDTGADYLIAGASGSCAIQRKDSVAELIHQMKELHDDILVRLRNFSDNPVLLVEESHIIGQSGNLFRKQDKLWVETGMHASGYYGFLETVRHMGIDVVTTRNLDASIWYMASMAGYLDRLHYPRHAKCHKIPAQAIGMLACVPGIAEKLAKEALCHTSIAGIAAGESGGLTERQAEKIRNVLNWRQP